MVAMGVAAAYTHMHMIEVFSSKSMELKWVRTRITKTSQFNKNKEKNLLTPLLPVYISTDPRHVDPQHLQHLCSTCNHSFQRFSDAPEPVDINKLRIALSHSDVLVSVFCKPNMVDGLEKSSSAIVDFLTPVSPSRDLLVGFGRAVSDCGLTASIYDLMVTLDYTFFYNKHRIKIETFYLFLIAHELNLITWFLGMVTLVLLFMGFLGFRTLNFGFYHS